MTRYYCIECGITCTFTHVRDEMRNSLRRTPGLPASAQSTVDLVHNTASCRVRYEVYACASCGHTVAFAVT